MSHPRLDIGDPEELGWSVGKLTQDAGTMTILHQGPKVEVIGFVLAYQGLRWDLVYIAPDRKCFPVQPRLDLAPEPEF